MEKSKLKNKKFGFKWYFAILLLYNFILPIKPTSPFLDEFVIAYGLGGFQYFMIYPLTFFINPLIIFSLIKLTIYVNKVIRGKYDNKNN